MAITVTHAPERIRVPSGTRLLERVDREREGKREAKSPAVTAGEAVGSSALSPPLRRREGGGTRFDSGMYIRVGLGFWVASGR